MTVRGFRPYLPAFLCLLVGFVAATKSSGATPPPPPTGLNATAADARISLSWVASAGATSYNVKRSTNGGSSYSALGSASNTSYSDAAVSNGKTYYYVVSAVNSGAESGNSASASAKPNGPAITATGSVNPTSNTTGANTTVTVTVKCTNAALNNGVVDLEFYDPSGNKEDQQFVSGQSIAAGASRSYTFVWTAPPVPGTYTLKLGVFGQNWAPCYLWNNSFKTVSVSASGTTTFTSSTTASPASVAKNNSAALSTVVTCTAGALSSGVIDVEVYDGAGNMVKQSFWSGVNLAKDQSITESFNWTPTTAGSYSIKCGVFGNGWTPLYHWNDASGTLTVTDTTPPPSPPAAPTGLTASAGNGQVSLTWTASSGATSYNVKRSTTSGSGYATVASPTGTSSTNTGLTNGTTYFYVVTAVGSGGESGNSNQASGTPQPSAPAAPTNLTATAGNAQAALSWTASSGAASYNLKRSTTSGSGYATVAGVTGTSYTNTGLTNGTAYYFVVTAVNGGGESANSSQVSATPMGAPAAPTGLTATGQWTNNAPHIVLAWSGSTGAATYTVYRDGSSYKTGLTATQYDDAAVATGETHSYRVSALNGAGASAQSSAASATAPGAPTGGGCDHMSMPSAPANLRIQGLWSGNAPTDVLSWDAAAGAQSYKVYQYGKLLAQGITGTTYTVPTNSYRDQLTYAVTTVDAAGMESIPSNPVTAQGANNPNVQPGWTPEAPPNPKNLVVTPEWNGTAPRIHLSWNAGITSNYQETSFTYNVYRDGTLIAQGLWGLNYYDSQVTAGQTRSYAVQAQNINWKTAVKSGLTSAVSGTAPSGAPAPSGSPVTITSVVNNDDSVVINFAAVPGAADYRAFVNTGACCCASGSCTCCPGGVCNCGANGGCGCCAPEVKYSGGGLSVEVNGLGPTGADVVVEAVDKLGPFQAMDGMMGPGAVMPDGTMHMAINGHGDPSNMPNTLASSGVFHVNCQPRSLTGAQAFFDNFQNPQPLAPFTVPAVMQNRWPAGTFAGLQNDKWQIYNSFGDLLTSSFFFDHSHFMDTTYDGGTIGSWPMHNNDASMLMTPKATADISGGKVLHVTFEVDGHFDARRWCDVFVTAANDLVYDAGNFSERAQLPTPTGNMFRWEIKHDLHMAQLFGNSGGSLVRTEIIDGSWNPGNDRDAAARIRWDGVPIFNGYPWDLDRRHKYDMYLSQNRVRIAEGGQTVIEKAFPSGKSLPFSQVKVWFVHQVYHTDNDRHEVLVSFPADQYWANYRPWCDERHWDNMGFEVLNAFP